MKNSFSVIDMLLIDYAAGKLTQAESFVVAAHISINPDSRRRFQVFEAAGGQALEKTPPAPVADTCLENVLRKIDGPVSAPATPAPAKRVSDLPDSIAALIQCNCSCDTIRWWRLAAGVAAANLPLPSRFDTSRKIRLVRIDPQDQLPLHGHTGREITLVLRGGFSDQTGTYRAGDLIVFDDPDFVHAPVATADGCIAMTLTEGPMVFADPVKRLINQVLRI